MVEARGDNGGAAPEHSTRGIRIAFLVFCTIGACLSADLIRLHVNVHTDPNYHSYCAMNERVNCETVAASDFAVFLNLPVAVWGFLAYTGFALLSIWGLRRRLLTPSFPFGILALLSLLAVGVGCLLFAISHFVIHSVCLVCMGTWAVNAGLLLLSFFELRRVQAGLLHALKNEIQILIRNPLAPLILAGSFSLVLVVLWIALPAYWKLDPLRGPSGMESGLTSDGHAWIGAPSPVLDILEFSDYQCPYCRRGHEDLRKLIEKYPDKIRLVHRHYPLDHKCNSSLNAPFHPSACDYAFMARCAGLKGLFWQANDYLYANGRRNEAVTAEELAKELQLNSAEFAGCVGSQSTRGAIEEDLAAGRSLKIQGTPTFVVGDRSYPGRIPPEVITSKLGLPAEEPAPAPVTR